MLALSYLILVCSGERASESACSLLSHSCVLWREGTRGCLLSIIWGGLCAVKLLSLFLILSVFSLRGTAAYHLFTGPDWPVREGTSFQETRDPVSLVSSKVGAHTRDNETDRQLR
jgi:hypothetical protein